MRSVVKISGGRQDVFTIVASEQGLARPKVANERVGDGWVSRRFQVERCQDRGRDQGGIGTAIPVRGPIRCPSAGGAGHKTSTVCSLPIIREKPVSRSQELRVRRDQMGMRVGGILQQEAAQRFGQRRR